MALQNSVICGAETIPASLSDIIIKKHVVKGLFIDGAANDVQWRIMSGKSRYPEHLPLLSRATSIFRVSCFYMVLDIFFLFSSHYMHFFFWAIVDHMH